MKQAAIIIMIMTVFSKIIGFGRDIILAYYYGASAISDAYLIAMSIPNIIFAFVGTALATNYIPMYSRIKNDFGSQFAERFTNNLLNFVFVLCTLIVLVVLFYTVPCIKLIAPGFEGITLDLAVQFTKATTFAIYIYGLMYIFISYLQMKNDFTVPALISIPFNSLVILSIILSRSYDLSVLAIGSTIAIVSQLIVLIIFAYKRGYRYNLILDLSDSTTQKTLYLTIPVVLGTSINQIKMLIDRSIASQIDIGAVSALTYATRLNDFIQGVFVLSITAVMYPVISKMAMMSNLEGLKKTISEAIVGMTLLVLPLAIGVGLFTEPIVRVLFARGAFSDQAIIMTSETLLFYSIGMFGFGVREILSKAFYSLQDTRTPTINAVFAMGLNIGLNFFFSKFLGIAGLALATSISALVCSGLLIISLRKKIGSLGICNIGVSFLKVLFASSIVGVIAKLTYSNFIFKFGTSLSLLAVFFVSGIIYATLIYFMKIDSVDLLVAKLKKYIKFKML